MTTINDLPDDLLTDILIMTTPWIDESITLTRVCQRWKSLMELRFAFVRYFRDESWASEPPSIEPSGKFLLGREMNSINKIRKYLKILPNLKVFMADSYKNIAASEFVDLMNSMPWIKGLSTDKWFSPSSSKTTNKVYWNVEMFDACGSPFVLNKPSCLNYSITQLCLTKANVDCMKILLRFPNLKRFRPSLGKWLTPSPSRNPTQSHQNLEILEVFLNDNLSTMEGFLSNLQFLPKLKSIFLCSEVTCQSFQLHSVEQHYGVENLVLQTLKYEDHRKDRAHLQVILKLFPNLKNLALKNFCFTEEQEIYQYLELLPKLEYLEVQEYRGPQGIAVCSSPTILDRQRIINYSVDHGKQIRCIVKTNSDSNNMSSYKLISEGFDFMEHIFPRNFHHVPDFLVENSPPLIIDHW